MPSPRLYLREKREIVALVGSLSVTCIGLASWMVRAQARSSRVTSMTRAKVMSLAVSITALGSSVMMTNSYNRGYTVGEHRISFERITGWGDLEVRNKFRFRASDAYAVFRHWGFSLDTEMLTRWRHRFTAEEAFLVVLARLAYPGRWLDLCSVFGRHPSELSEGFNFMLSCARPSFVPPWGGLLRDTQRRAGSCFVAAGICSPCACSCGGAIACHGTQRTQRTDGAHAPQYT